MKTRIIWERPREQITRLTSDAIHIWRRQLSASKGEIETLWSHLSTDECDRAAKFHFAKDRNNFVVARGSLRFILSQYTAIPPALLTFSYGTHKKPALTNSGKLAIDFNISHSGDFAVYAIGRERRIGIDVEKIRADITINELAAAHFSSEEYEALLTLCTNNRLERFFAVWTCKEAYVKARGEGLYVPMHRFDVLFGTGGAPTIQAEDGLWHLSAFSVEEEHPAAVVYDGPTARLLFFEVDRTNASAIPEARPTKLVN